MNKGQVSSSSDNGTTAGDGPLPSAPPSYEEAVGLATGQAVPAIPAVPGGPPYPVAGARMPMPSPYAPPIAQIAQMPLPTQSISSTSQTRTPEIRVVHQHLTLSLGPNPIKMSCPSCHADVKTTTMSDHQPSAHVCCIILCLLGCCLCSCLPYCLSAFLSVHHFCPNCKAYIGTWKG